MDGEQKQDGAGSEQIKQDAELDDEVIVEEGDEAEDNLLDGERPSRLEEFELDDDEDDED